MRNGLFFGCFLILFSFFVTKNILAQEFNYAPNNSFETGENFPANWTVNNEQFCNQQTSIETLETRWNATLAYSGSKSIGFQNINLPKHSIAPHTRIVSDFIEIPINQRYEISGKATTSQNSTGLIPILEICFYDQLGNPIYHESFGTNNAINNQFWYSFGYTYPNFFTSNKIKLALRLACYSSYLYSPPCVGSIWFDDIKVEPVGDIKAHKFEDKNKNGTQDDNEPSLKGWEIGFYLDRDCKEQNAKQYSKTDQSGNTTFKDIPFGEYSVKETFYVSTFSNTPPYYFDATKEGWVNTIELCQNVTLDSNNGLTVNIGNYHAPPFPYLSQKDPAWATQEYDHGNSIGPFFCGTTIGGCGCAITSSAMILKYHGATKSPTGEETSPATLNNWLKNNNGYAFGALKWNSIAAYSVKANQNFGTQKIRFAGTGPPNNFSMLDTNLASNNPAILEEPGHFIVAKSKQSPTYAINDPAFANKTTLNAYSNNFLSMRRFEKTSTDLSAIYISTPAPNEILITDSLGRRTGRDPQNGQTYSEIPNSYYFLEPIFTDQTSNDPVSLPSNSGVNMLVIINPLQDNYEVESASGQIDFSGYDQNGEITSKLLNLTGNNLEFALNYSPQPGTELNVTQVIKISAEVSNSKVEIDITNQPGFDVEDVILSSLTIGQSHFPPSKTKLKDKGGKDKKNTKLKIILKTKNIGGFSENPVCLFGQTKNGTPFKGCDFIKVHR